MKRITALLIFFILLIFPILTVKVSAADWYKTTLTREIFLDNTSRYNVINTFTLNNTSDKYIIKSFDYFSPLPFTDAQAIVGNKNLNISVSGSHISIQLGDQFLKPLKQEVIIIKLKVPEIVQPVRTNAGEIIGAQLFLPKDTTKSLDLFCQTIINFDNSEFKVSYVSNEAVITDKKIQFTKNVDLFIDFTNVSGFTIKYKGENNSILIPSSIFNKVIYDKIPSDGKLSKDSINNSYISKAGTIEYELKSFSDIKIDSLNSNNVFYFKKEELTGFKLEDTVKGFYDQVIKKYSPETSKLNTQTLNFDQYKENSFNDSLGYSLTLASLIQQKGLKSEVVFGRVKFPLSQTQHWHFWVMYQEDGKLKQIDPYMEDLLTFDGFFNITSQRAIIAEYYNDANLINSIDNMIKDKTEIEFLTDNIVLGTSQLAKLDVVKEPDTFYPKLKFSYKNLSSSVVKIKGIELNGAYSSFNDLEINPGDQKEFEISLAMNIVDIVAKKGEVKIKAVVIEENVEKSYEVNTKIPNELLLSIVMVNFVSLFIGLAILLIIVIYKRPKTH